MKHARLIVPLAALAVIGAGATMPAMAAKPKLAGSYKLALQPDPTIQVLTEAGMANCASTRKESADRRTFTLPGAGKFKVNLDAPDPVGRNTGFDWDMYLLDDKGTVLGKGTSAGAKEEATIVLKRKTAVTIAVCNITGMTDGTVTYSFK